MTNKKSTQFFHLIVKVIIIAVIVFAIFNIFKRHEQKITDKENIKSLQDDSIINFEIKDVKASKGDNMDIEIELLTDSDFVAANFEYVYDNNKLEYIDYETGKALNGAAMLLVNNDEENGKLLIGFVANPQGEKIIKAGNLLNLNFKIRDNISKEEIKNEFYCTTLKNESGTDIKYKIKQGLIKIK